MLLERIVLLPPGAMPETTQLSNLLKTYSRDSILVLTVPITFQTQGITS